MVVRDNVFVLDGAINIPKITSASLFGRPKMPIRAFCSLFAAGRIAFFFFFFFFFLLNLFTAVVWGNGFPFEILISGRDSHKF